VKAVITSRACIRDMQKTTLLHRRIEAQVSLGHFFPHGVFHVNDNTKGTESGALEMAR